MGQADLCKKSILLLLLLLFGLILRQGLSSPGWCLTCCVAQVDPELMILQHPLPRAAISGECWDCRYHCTQARMVQGTGFKAFYKLAKHSAELHPLAPDSLSFCD